MQTLETNFKCDGRANIKKENGMITPRKWHDNISVVNIAIAIISVWKCDNTHKHSNDFLQQDMFVSREY